MRTGIRCGNAHVQTVHVTGETKAGTACGRKTAKWAPGPCTLERAREWAQNACYRVCSGCEKRDDALTSEERRAIAALQRLAARWPKSLMLVHRVDEDGLTVVRADSPLAPDDREPLARIEIPADAVV